MNESTALGPTALALCGLAARLLGWRPRDFWNATPAELATILAPDPATDGDRPLSRAEFEHLLEHDHDR